MVRDSTSSKGIICTAESAACKTVAYRLSAANTYPTMAGPCMTAILSAGSHILAEGESELPAPAVQRHSLMLHICRHPSRPWRSSSGECRHQPIPTSQYCAKVRMPYSRALPLIRYKVIAKAHWAAVHDG
jgi:hypothetical protein